ncbi:MAG: hypothetical protein P4L91_14605 [Burkholderiaceae bacterium]|nr:hypothetical protein [Burkholderiaceae bacterium]
MWKSLIFPVVVSLIVWFAQDRLKDVPTIAYSISDAIEIVGAQGKTEYAQEISVINSGKSETKAISIRIPHHIASYKLTKHSLLTKESTSSDADTFELDYPELPAGQKIRVLVRYDGYPIEKKWISVSHAAGPAQPLENPSNSINYAAIVFGFWIGLIVTGLSGFRDMQKQLFALSRKKDDLFRDDKPWFGIGANWSDIQFHAIENSLQNYDFGPLDQKFCFILLTRQKPALLSTENWEKLKDQAEKKLVTAFSEEIARYKNNKSHLIDLLKINKPEGLPLSSWTEFREAVELQLQSLFFPLFPSNKDFIDILDPRNSSLSELPEKISKEIRNIAQERYVKFLLGKSLEQPSECETLFETARLDLVTPEQSKRLNDHLNKLVKIFSMPYSFDLYYLRKFIASGKPQHMSDSDFNSICDFVTKIDALSSDKRMLDDRERDVSVAEYEVETIKKHVKKQLEMIDKVLTNPDMIDKIESYDQTFAPGNRKNLELVAALLKQRMMT